MSTDVGTEGFFRSIYKNKAFRAAFEKTANSIQLQGPIRQALTRHCKEVLLFHIKLTENIDKVDDLNRLLENCALIHGPFTDIISFMQIHDTILMAYFKKEYSRAYMVDKVMFKALETYFKEVRTAIRLILESKEEDTLPPGDARLLIQNELKEREQKLISVYQNRLSETKKFSYIMGNSLRTSSYRSCPKNEKLVPKLKDASPVHSYADFKNSNEADEDEYVQIGWQNLYEEYTKLSCNKQLYLSPNCLKNTLLVINELILQLEVSVNKIQKTLSAFTNNEFRNRYATYAHTRGNSLEILAIDTHIAYILLTHRKVLQIFLRNQTAGFRLLHLISLSHNVMGISCDDLEEIDLALLKVISEFEDIKLDNQIVAHLIAYFKSVTTYISRTMTKFITKADRNQLTYKSKARAHFRLLKKWEIFVNTIKQEHTLFNNTSKQSSVENVEAEKEEHVEIKMDIACPLCFIKKREVLQGK